MLLKHWKTETTYVDKETGEILTKKEVKENYDVTNKIKTVSHASKEYAGIVQYRVECKRRPKQLTISFT